MSRLLTVPAGRRAKWIVFGLWMVLIFGAFAANLPGKFADADLSIAEVNGTAGLGPIGALGIATAMIAMLTLLPAML